MNPYLTQYPIINNADLTPQLEPLLSREEATRLIRLSEANDTLRWSEEAVEKIWALTAGYAFFIQQLCSQIWHQFTQTDSTAKPIVTEQGVEQALSVFLEHEAFTRLWEGLSTWEQVLVALIASHPAQETTKNTVVPQDKNVPLERMVNLLQDYGLQLETDILEQTCQRLQEWHWLDVVDEGYRLTVALLSQWVQAKYSVETVANQHHLLSARAGQQSPEMQLQDSLQEQQQLEDKYNYEVSLRFRREQELEQVQAKLDDLKNQLADAKDTQQTVHQAHQDLLNQLKEAMEVRQKIEQERQTLQGQLKEAQAFQQGVQQNPFYRLYNHLGSLFSGSLIGLILVICAVFGYLCYFWLEYQGNDGVNGPTSEETITAPAPIFGKKQIRSIDQMSQVYVPAGIFMMGSSDRDALADREEKPQHQVILDDFWLDQTEVTNAQFVQFLNEKGNQIEGDVTWLDIESSESLIIEADEQFQPKTNFEDHPVTEVTWYGAKAYCEWAGGRLPTEAEWEYAALGLLREQYPWGEEFSCQHTNASGPGCSGNRQTMPVKRFPSGVSWVEAHDMAGNVWEWTADWYQAEYYANALVENPAGPDSGEEKTLRGGSWITDMKYVRSTYRGHNIPNTSNQDVGFRCVNDSL